eukprot:1187051-Prorocentrum_minimum.AAC.1
MTDRDRDRDAHLADDWTQQLEASPPSAALPSLLGLMSMASPVSEIFATPSESSRMFAGFRSQCTTGSA